MYEVIPFNDYVLPNESLNSKDVDANAFQSLPYLEAQSKERGYHFAILTKTFIFPIAAYSKKIKTLKIFPMAQLLLFPMKPLPWGVACCSYRLRALLN